MSPFTRIRLALYATYVALRAVGYVLMFKLGFVPQHMHAEMVAKFVAAEARATALATQRDIGHGWRTVAEMRRVVLERHNLYTPQLAHMEVMHAGVVFPPSPDGPPRPTA